MNSAVELKHLSKIYGKAGKNETIALSDIDLSVDRGDFVAIMGRSGSGKTSLMNVVGLLDQHFEGEYILDGTSVKNLSRGQLSDLRSLQIGFVFQQFNLLKRRTVLQNVLLPTIYNPGKDDKKRAIAAIQRVGLAERIDHKTNELSGGQIQRVAIARALMMNPTILLADEPTGNLDTKSSQAVMELFLEINKQGTTIILITHDDDIASYADRIIYLNDGNIVEKVKK